MIDNKCKYLWLMLRANKLAQPTFTERLSKLQKKKRLFGQKAVLSLWHPRYRKKATLTDIFLISGLLQHFWSIYYASGWIMYSVDTNISPCWYDGWYWYIPVFNVDSDIFLLSLLILIHSCYQCWYWYIPVIYVDNDIFLLSMQCWECYIPVICVDNDIFLLSMLIMLYPIS